jgi:hypothetical protein
MARTVNVAITKAATNPTLPEAPHYVVDLIPPAGITAPPVQSFSVLPTAVTFSSVPDGVGWRARCATKGATNNDLIAPVTSASFDIVTAQTYQVAGTITVTLV